jgi:superfamily II DNA or RNA helicase
MREFFKDPNNPNITLVVLPTGSGKSGIAALAPYVLNSSRVLVITPSVIITKQLAIDFGYVSH